MFWLMKCDIFSIFWWFYAPNNIIYILGLARDITVKDATEMLEKYKDSEDKKDKLIANRATQILQILDWCIFYIIVTS